jgi:histidine triad (HIT) family protein
MDERDSAACVFCKIARGEIPAPRLAENDEFLCIRDIHPQAREHLLVLPKEHIESLAEMFPHASEGRPKLMGRMLDFATQVAWERGLLPAGFRTVINTGKQGGQTVFHLHVHLLGGEPLGGSFN